MVTAFGILVVVVVKTFLETIVSFFLVDIVNGVSFFLVGIVTGVSFFDIIVILIGWVVSLSVVVIGFVVMVVMVTGITWAVRFLIAALVINRVDTLAAATFVIVVIVVCCLAATMGYVILPLTFSTRQFLQSPVPITILNTFPDQTLTSNLDTCKKVA